MIVFTRERDSDIQEVDGRLVDVFVNEQIRKCVTFLYEDVLNEETNTVERVAVGTAFLISKSLDNSDLDVYDHNLYPQQYANYLVTARHVITDNMSDTIYVRLNRDSFHLEECWQRGKFQDIPTRVEDWIPHPKEGTTDVAVYRLKMPSGHFAVKAMPFSTLTTKIFTAREGIKSGGEVFFVGLFSGHLGMERVEPVIRFGNISLMLPFEKIQVYLSHADQTNNKPTAVEAYLIEAKSWGGQSGSPVLLYHPPLEDARSLPFMFRLPLILGLVQSHYEDDSPLPNGTRRSLINTGMAIVIPADKIRETIMQKKLADERKKILERTERHKAKGAPKPALDSTRREVEFTQDDFTNALEKASQKISQPDKEKNET